MVIYDRTNQIPTVEKRPIDTKDIDDDFMRKYDEMYKLMQYKQTHDYYEAWRHIQSAMEGDTPILGLWDRQSTRRSRWLPESEVLYLFSQWS